jgi:hypothetical protein
MLRTYAIRDSRIVETPAGTVLALFMYFWWRKKW